MVVAVPKTQIACVVCERERETERIILGSKSSSARESSTLDWAVHRHLFYPEADALGGRFDANKNVLINNIIMEDANATSFIIKHVDTKRKQDQDVLSVEDFAWADSCLIADPDISETSMESVREALLNIIDLHSVILEHSTNKQDSSSQIDDLKNLPSFIDEGPSQTADTSSNDHLEEEIVHVLSSLKQQPFLPNYKDEMLKTQYSDDDDDLGFVFSESAMDQPLSDNIFKVWDLDIPVEEDELDTQLKEALSSNAGTRVPPRRKGLDIESVDSLVESIADLSLK